MIIIYLMLLLAIFAFIYLLINNLKNQRIRERIKEKIILNNKNYKTRNFNNKNKIGLMDKLYLLMLKTGISENKFLWWISPFTIILFCIILMIISTFIFLPILKLKILTIIFCIPIGFMPIFILFMISDVYEAKLENNIISYIIQLKNQARINNDIIVCFQNTVKYAQKPLSSYINIFLLEVQQGVNLYTAFDNLKSKVNNDKFKQLITNLENCYFNGGNLYTLLEKTQNVFMKLQNERNKRNEDTMSARIVLIILIAISIFIYFKFINFNPDNFNIMINDLFGQIILYFNFLSIWAMLFLIINVKKFDN